MKVARLISPPLFFNVPPKQFPDHVQCQGCPRCGEAGPAVMAEGNFKSQFIFIGREPGEQEVEHQRPFYPQAPGGRLFAEYLQQLGLERKETFITNTVFCRGKSNRAPTPEETVRCLPYHAHEFSMLSAKTLFVFPLGNNAMTLVTGMATSVVHTQGNCYTASHGASRVFIFPLLHPGSILRRGSEKEKLFTLLSEIRKFIRRRGHVSTAVDTSSIL